MISRPLLVFDFDGVIVDGICEYWWSSRKACLRLLGKESNASELPEVVPEEFRKLRPWVHHGWEMVLIAAELIRPNSPLRLIREQSFSKNYQKHCEAALNAWNWEPKHLQKTLDDVRREAICTNRKNWLASHKAFPGVPKRLNELHNEGYDFAVLTTKSSKFTAELLDHFQIKPTLLFGYESGSKPNVLVQLSKSHVLKGFIEDRLSTLKTVLNTNQLESLPCYLAGWGYLKDGESKNLPSNIQLLDIKTFLTPLASWP